MVCYFFKVKIKEYVDKFTTLSFLSTVFTELVRVDREDKLVLISWNVLENGKAAVIGENEVTLSSLKSLLNFESPRHFMSRT